MSSRQNKTSLKTKARIQQCFLELLEEKPMSEITVTELAQKAQINRVTFYSHYAGLPELLQEIQHEAAACFIRYDAKGIDRVFSAIENEITMKSFFMDDWLSGIGQKEMTDYYLDHDYPAWHETYGINMDEYYRMMAFIYGGTRAYMQHWYARGESEDKYTEAVDDFKALIRFSMLFLNYKAKKYGRQVPPPEDILA